MTPSIRGNKCCSSKAPARFIQVCKPLRYKPIEVVTCDGSNPMIVPSYDCKCLNQRVPVKKKSKYPLMKGKGIQTMDTAVEDKMTQFPDMGRTVKEKEYVEYEVTKPSGSKETIYKTITSDIKYDHLNVVEGIKKEELVSKTIVNSDNKKIIAENINLSEDIIDGRVYKKLESFSKSFEPGKETRQHHIELVSSSKRHSSGTPRSSRLFNHHRSVEKKNLKTGLGSRSRSAQKAPRSGGGKVESFIDESQNQGKSVQSDKRPNNIIKTCTCKRKSNVDQLMPPPSVSTNMLLSRLDGIGSNSSERASNTLEWQYANADSNEELANDKKQKISNKDSTISALLQNGSSDSISGKEQLLHNVSCIGGENEDSKGEPQDSPNIDSIDPESGELRNRSSEKSDKCATECGETKDQVIAPQMEEARNSLEKSPKRQSPVTSKYVATANGETRNSSGKSSPKRQSLVVSKSNSKSEEERKGSYSNGQSQVSPTDEARTPSQKSSPKRQSLVVSKSNSKSEEERKGSYSNGQSQVSPTDEARTPSQKSSPKGQSLIFSKYETTSDEVEGDAEKTYVNESIVKSAEEEEKAEALQRRTDLNITNSQKLLQSQNQESANNSGQTKIKTRVYKTTEEEKSDAAGNFINTLSIHSVSDTEMINDNIEYVESEIEVRQIEDADYACPINNCFRGPQRMNTYGYCCSAYWRMCNMRGCNNCMNYPGVSSCNGQCCSYNCRYSRSQR